MRVSWGEVLFSFNFDPLNFVDFQNKFQKLWEILKVKVY